ncbi:MAG: twin-arginine translocase TatA/TatE family subunit [Acidobacteriota bacterium]
MLGSLGVPELLFIFTLALLIFGPRKLPEIGRTIGKGLAEFRRASTDLKRTINAEMIEEEIRTSDPRRILREDLKSGTDSKQDASKPAEAKPGDSKPESSPESQSAGSASAGSKPPADSDAEATADSDAEGTVEPANPPGSVARGSVPNGAEQDADPGAPAVDERAESPAQ